MTLRVYELVRTIINAILAIVAFFLMLRIVFLLFSVNQATPFVSWILSVSGFLIAPFAGIVPNLGLATGVVDIVALISLLAYFLVGYLIISLLHSLLETRITEEEHEATTHYHDIEPEHRKDASHRHS